MALKTGLLYLIYVLGPVAPFIMPLTNTNGSPNIGNIINHLTLLEQKVTTLETKDHDRELMVNTLKTQFTTSQQTILDLKNQIVSSNDKIHELETDIALLKSLTGSNPQPTLSSPDLASVKTDVDKLKKDVSRLQFNVSTSGGGSSSGIGTILSEITGLKQNISTLQAAGVITTGGATFVRWGRTDCPIGNDVIYKGYAGGKHYDEVGSGTNHLCLPDNPIYGTHHSLTTSKLYGVEYEPDRVFSGIASGDNVPCAVCQSQTRSNSLMIPARNQCFAGWNLEYSGLVMSAFHTSYGKEYICVDERPQAIPGGKSYSRQSFLHPVSSMCGALECPPYINGLVITCAVCTK